MKQEIKQQELMNKLELNKHEIVQVTPHTHKCIYAHPPINKAVSETASTSVLVTNRCSLQAPEMV